MNTKERILQIKQIHPDWGVKRIAKETGIPNSTVRYHASVQVRDSANARVKIYKKTQRFALKFHRFREKKKNFDKSGHRRRHKAPSQFTAKQLYHVLSANPVCYLTGEKIDLLNDSYAFDHIAPVSRGGTNEIENLGLTTKLANKAKADMPHADFIALCLKVVQHAGYKLG